jgi:hypothetical protein
MTRTHRVARSIGGAAAAAALFAAVPSPASAAGPGPGHDQPNVPGVNVLAKAGSEAAVSLVFTGHTDRQGEAHGSLVFRDGDIRLRTLELERLAVVDDAAAAANGCSHGEMIIARGQAQLAGVGTVKVWVDLQDRPEGDRARVRIRSAASDHHDGGHDTLAPDILADDGHDHEDPDGHDPGGGHDGDDGGHDPGGGHDGGDGGHDSGWLYRSHWQSIDAVDVHLKGYQR